MLNGTGGAGCPGRDLEGAMGLVGRPWVGRNVWGAVCLGCLIGLFWPAAASARESRVVADERFELTVGFVVEPAYEGEPNGLSVRIVELIPATPEVEGVTLDDDPATPPAEPTPTPAPGAELTAEVIFGDQRLPLTLQDRKSTRLNSSHGYISYAVF